MPILDGEIIVIKSDLKKSLDKIKLHPKEPYYMVIDRLFKCYEFDNTIWLKVSQKLEKERIANEGKKLKSK